MIALPARIVAEVTPPELTSDAGPRCDATPEPRAARLRIEVR